MNYNIFLLLNPADIMSKIINATEILVFLVPFTAILIIMNICTISFALKDGVRGFFVSSFFFLFTTGFLGAVVGLVLKIYKLAIIGGIVTFVFLALLILLVHFFGDKDSETPGITLKESEKVSKEEIEELNEKVTDKASKMYDFIVIWFSNKWKIFLIVFIIGIVIGGGIFIYQLIKIIGYSSFMNLLKLIGQLFITFIAIPSIPLAIFVVLVLVVKKLVNKYNSKNNDNDTY